MEFEMYKEKKEETPKVIFKCSVSKEGRFIIRAVDTNGEFLANIITITPEGTFYRPSNIDPDLGFQLDINGRIEEDE